MFSLHVARTGKEKHVKRGNQGSRQIRPQLGFFTIISVLWGATVSEINDFMRSLPRSFFKSEVSGPWDQSTMTGPWRFLSIFKKERTFVGH